MEDKKEFCENQFKIWKELKERFPKAQKIITEINFKEQVGVSNGDREEFYKLTEEIKKQCLGFLSPEQKNELER